MGNSKIIFGGETLIDLTADSVEEKYLLRGKTAHNKKGEIITGECDYNADTRDATATASMILDGETAYVNGVKIKGEMPNRGAVKGTIADINAAFDVESGFHDGGGKVTIDATEKGKITPSNIRSGISILGVVGEMTGEEAITSQEKTVKPKREPQTITPDKDIDYLTQVYVEGIPYIVSDNEQGGKTITIG